MEFLNAWKGTGESIVARTEELWIALYEHDFFKLEDVKLVQLWLQTLINIGYNFPKLVENQDVPIPEYPPLHINSVDDMNKEDSHCTFDQHRVSFWTSDLHDGTRLDIPTLLAGLGQNITLAGTKEAKIPYPDALKRSVYSKLSPMVGHLFQN